MIVVFNDSFGSDAFEETIRAVNTISKDKISVRECVGKDPVRVLPKTIDPCEDC